LVFILVTLAATATASATNPGTGAGAPPAANVLILLNNFWQRLKFSAEIREPALYPFT
jgi:hypothetical protein